MKRPNDVILRTVTKVAAVIILTFSIHLFISGHHFPGGGFIGGLTFTAAITLLFLVYGIDTIRKNVSADFKVLQWGVDIGSYRGGGMMAETLLPTAVQLICPFR